MPPLSVTRLNPKGGTSVRRKPAKYLVLLLVALVLGLLGLQLSSAPGESLAAAGRAGAAEITTDPRTFKQLERMAQALKTTNFEGILVYQFGQSLSTLRIVHRYAKGVSQQSLLTLNGPLRTIGRSDQAVACLLSGGQAMLLKHHDQLQRANEAPGTPAAVPLDWQALAMHYQFAWLKATRVAGRNVDVIGILPRDDLRYGYRFAIDQTSFLPLSTALTDAQGGLIQRLMFTDIHLLPGVQGQASQVAATQPASGLASQPVSQPSSQSAERPPADVPWRARFHDLPAGFKLRTHDWMESDSGGPPIEYFLFSDGLASVSLYIEPSDQAGLLGSTQMATIHAAGRWTQGYQITAVGEVPAAAVVALLDAVDSPAARAPRPSTPQSPQQTRLK